MNLIAIVSWMYYPVAAVALLTAIMAIARRRAAPRWFRGVAIGGIAFSLAMTYVKYQVPYDYKLFWQCGRDVRTGIDAYGLDPWGSRQLVLNPPTALPLFAIFASLPLRKGAALWTALNALAAIGLVRLAQRALIAQDGDEFTQLPPVKLGVLASAVVLSNAQCMGTSLGQLSVLTTVAILMAIHAQGAAKPIRAGVWLALATVKAGTMLPFLILFHRKKDLPTWATMGVVTLGLCLATGPASELPHRVSNNLNIIKAYSCCGMVNDYSYSGPSHASMIGLDHAFYRLGMRDRGLIGNLQFVVLAVVGLGLARSVWGERFSRGAGCALVGLYSAIFLYHRIYDTLILVLPLTYCAGLASSLPTRRRRSLIVCGAICLMVMYLSPKALLGIERLSFGMGAWGKLLRAVVLPYATVLILLGIVALWSTLPSRGVRGRADRPTEPARRSSDSPGVNVAGGTV